MPVIFKMMIFSLALRRSSLTDLPDQCDNATELSCTANLNPRIIGYNVSSRDTLTT